MERSVVTHVAVRSAVLAAAALALAGACDHDEDRRYAEPAPSTAPSAPGYASKRSIYDDNPWAIAQGKMLYQWFNCVGCHHWGGGGIGPPLMDGEWIYGSRPEDIYESIVEGRRNGMPSFRGKIPAHQVWQIVAYVRSMSGLVDPHVAPGRADGMSTRQPEAITPSQEPRRVDRSARREKRR